jgi:hypothetical protein
MAKPLTSNLLPCRNPEQKGNLLARDDNSRTAQHHIERYHPMQQQVAGSNAAEPLLENQHRDIPDREKSRPLDQIAAPAHTKFASSNHLPAAQFHFPSPTAAEVLGNSK